MADTLKEVIVTLRDTLNDVDLALDALTDQAVKESLNEDTRTFSFLQQCAAQLLANINEKKQRNAKTCLGESATRLLQESAASMAALGVSNRLSQQQSNDVLSEAGLIADVATRTDALIKSIATS